jgi:diguanylate cyclase (GGDEF)-like protein/PAS domain S-box-containing protein
MKGVRKTITMGNGAILEGFPGAALLVNAVGAVVSANEEARALQTLIECQAVPEIPLMVARAVDEDTIVVGGVTLNGAKGNMMLEVTVVPRQEENDLLLLVREVSMEHNLRVALVESRQRYKDFVDISSDFSWEVGADGTFVFVSPRGALGFSAEELVGRSPGDFVVGLEDDDSLPFLSDDVLEGIDVWMRQADEKTACMCVSSQPMRDESGKRVGARGVCRDVTSEREQNSALVHAHHREQLLNFVVATIRNEIDPLDMLSAAAAATTRSLGASGCRIYRLDETGGFMMAAEYGSLGGTFPADDLLTDETKGREVIETRDGDWQVLVSATLFRKEINGAICLQKKVEDGGWQDDDRLLIGDVANQLGIANEQINIHERAITLSRTDGLTGLLNRRAFCEEDLPRRIKRLNRSNDTAALFYIDMDNFKLVNDTHGHKVGDEAILFLRDMMLEHSRPGDSVVRLGGDEFAMWLDCIDEASAMRRVKALLEKGKALQKFSGDQKKPLGLSIGVAIYNPEFSETPTDLLSRADGAMYGVKKSGKGGVLLAPPVGKAKKKATGKGRADG